MYARIVEADPHLILTIFLPILLFESAFAMEVHTFIKTFIQVVVLAIPGLGKYLYTEDLRLSGSIIRKSRFILTKERRIIRQKSGCLSHSNERIFQVNIQMQGRIKDSWKGVSYAYKMLVSLCGFYHLF